MLGKCTRTTEERTPEPEQEPRLEAWNGPPIVETIAGFQHGARGERCLTPGLRQDLLAARRSRRISHLGRLAGRTALARWRPSVEYSICGVTCTPSRVERIVVGRLLASGIRVAERAERRPPDIWWERPTA